MKPLSPVGLLAFSLLLMMALPLPHHSASAAEFDDLREKYVTWLVGRADYNTENPELVAALKGVVESVSNGDKTGVWDTMEKASIKSLLWQDLHDAGVPTSANTNHMTKSYDRLLKMAVAYATPHSSLLGNATLKHDILEGLDYLHEYRFNKAALVKLGNWWDWEIGSPQSLLKIVMLMYNDMSPELRMKYVSVVLHFVPNITHRKKDGTFEVGANRADKALVRILAGIIAADSTILVSGQEPLSHVFLYVKSGDGFYEDGSFIQHNSIPYIGTYGDVLLKRIADITNLLKGSQWAITDPNLKNVYRWLKDSVEPFVFKGAMMEGVSGRAITREWDSDRARGHSMLKTWVLYTAFADPDDVDYLRRVLKKWGDDDFASVLNLFPKLSLTEALLLDAIVKDNSITPKEDLVMSKVYSMARAVHRRKHYAYSVSMFSPRVSCVESGNGENENGWYTGIGMTYLLDGNHWQYLENYWPTVDLYRLAGTTTDGSPGVKPVAWKSYFNSQQFVGGATLENKFSVVGMHFDLKSSLQRNLRGKKSWFLFDEELVAMGTEIGLHGDRPAETIVDNRKIDFKDNLTINGENNYNDTTYSHVFSNVHWAHLHVTSDPARLSDIGYFFPYKATLKIAREERKGSWKDINKDGSTDIKKNLFVNIAFPYSSSTVDGGYTYVLLPGKNYSQTRDYALHGSKIEIHSATSDMHAVYHKDLKILMVNFWNPSKISYIQAYNPMCVVTKEEDSKDENGPITISVSDPYQKQHSLILEVLRVNYEVIDSNSREVQTIRIGSVLKLRINTLNSLGKTITFKVAKKKKQHRH